MDGKAIFLINISRFGRNRSLFSEEMGGRPTRRNWTSPLTALVIAFGLFSCGQGQSPAGQSTNAADASGNLSSFAGPIRIVKLLWKSNPKSAANTLSRSLSTGLERGETDALKMALRVLETHTAEVVSAADLSDPRYAVALASQQLLLSPQASPLGLLPAALEHLADNESRRLLWRVWLVTDRTAALAYFSSHLKPPETVEASPAAPQTELRQEADSWPSIFVTEALAAAPAEASQLVLAKWTELKTAQQLAAIEPMTSNAAAMRELIQAISAGTVSKDLVNTNQLRKWLSSGQAALSGEIEAIWGKIRLEDNAARQALVASTLKQIQQPGTTGSVTAGSKVFDRACSQCHALHGRGYEVGPNILANGRGNLQQLVSNVLDPSLVIGEAFQSLTLLTFDGEVVSGLLVEETAGYVKLKVQGGKVLEFSQDDIEQRQVGTQSLMPVGVEGQMTQQELLDLFAYLCLLKAPGAADNELIPGTPDDFVQP